MQQQWRIRIRGKQRKVLDVGLVVQAVIALGQQFGAEARSRASDDEPAAPVSSDAPESEGQS